MFDFRKFIFEKHCFLLIYLYIFVKFLIEVNTTLWQSIL